MPCAMKIVEHASVYHILIAVNVTEADRPSVNHLLGVVTLLSSLKASVIGRTPLPTSAIQCSVKDCMFRVVPHSALPKRQVQHNTCFCFLSCQGGSVLRKFFHAVQ